MSRMMPKVVIDTNVIVSALLTPHGKSAQVLDMIFEEKLEPCYCAEILAEYAKVLSRPRFDFSAEDQKNVIDGFVKFGKLTEPLTSNAHFTDASDRIFYEVAGKADAYIVTGNVKHFPSESHVISPAECVNLITPE